MPEAYDLLLDRVSDDVAAAASLVSVPHWVDDALAIQLIASFGGTNGATRHIVSEVKRLPFVAPHGATGWKVTQPVRAALSSRIDEDVALARSVNGFLVEHLDAARNRASGVGGPGAVELEWRALYHRVPLDPADAIAKLDTFVDEAAGLDRLSDVRAAVDLAHSRSSWLGAHTVEILFLEGRYAYARRDFETAEERFAAVWNSGGDNHRRVVAGHLLGVIWTTRRREPWWSEAAVLLEDVADLAQEIGDRHGEAMIRTTLGTLLGRLGGRGRLNHAVEVLRRSLEIGASSGLRSEYLALSSLGFVLTQRNSGGDLIEAERVLRKSLALAPADARTSIVDRLARALAMQGGDARLAEAEKILRDHLATDPDDADAAVKLNTLASVLLRMHDQSKLEEAAALSKRSVELGRKTGNDRHVAMALLTASWVAERQHQVGQAIALIEEVIEINRALGLSRQVTKSEERLRRLRRAR